MIKQLIGCHTHNFEGIKTLFDTLWSRFWTIHSKFWIYLRWCMTSFRGWEWHCVMIMRSNGRKQRNMSVLIQSCVLERDIVSQKRMKKGKVRSVFSNKMNVLARYWYECRVATMSYFIQMSYAVSRLFRVQRYLIFLLSVENCTSTSFRWMLSKTLDWVFSVCWAGRIPFFSINVWFSPTCASHTLEYVSSPARDWTGDRSRWLGQLFQALDYVCCTQSRTPNAIALWGTFSSVPLRTYQHKLVLHRPWLPLHKYVISTHSCSIHFVFLRGQVTFYSLCVTLLVRVIASFLTVLKISPHEETVRTRVYASSCVCPARLPSWWSSFRCWGLIVSSNGEGKGPRQGCWLFDGWRILLEVVRWFRRHSSIVLFGPLCSRERLVSVHGHWLASRLVSECVW